MAVDMSVHCLIKCDCVYCNQMQINVNPTSGYNADKADWEPLDLLQVHVCCVTLCCMFYILVCCDVLWCGVVWSGVVGWGVVLHCVALHCVVLRCVVFFLCFVE